MKPPAFQFYPDDFLGGVADMTQAEVGAYILLLCSQWGRGEIPPDPDRAALIAKGPVSTHVLAKFPNGQNPRLEAVRIEQDNYRRLQREKGLASGEARRKRVTTEAQPRFNSGSTTVQPDGQPKVNPPYPLKGETSLRNLICRFLHKRCRLRRRRPRLKFSFAPNVSWVVANQRR